jgi:hypothetical protein
MKKKLVASCQGHRIKFSRDKENRGSTTMVNLEHSHDPMKWHSIALSMSRKTSQSLGNAEGIAMASIVACTAPGTFSSPVGTWVPKFGRAAASMERQVEDAAAPPSS